MVRLLRFFSLASLGAFVVAALLLALFYQDLTRNHARDAAKTQIVQAAHADGDQLHPLILKVLAGQDAAPLRRAAMADMQSSSLLRFALYDAKGILVFTTGREPLGLDLSQDVRIRKALAGGVTADYIPTPQDSPRQIEPGNAMAVFIPAGMTGTDADSGAAAGAAELVYDSSAWQRPSLLLNGNLLLGLFAVMLALYAALFLITRHYGRAWMRQINDNERLSAARRAAEQDSSDQRARLHLVTDSVPALIGYIDGDHRYGFHNKRFEEWFGRSEINGSHVRDVVGEDRYRLLLPYFDQAMSGAATAYENKLRRADGAERDIHGDLVPHIVEGEVRGFFFLVYDITDHKRIEKDLLGAHDAMHREVEARTRALRASEQRLRDIAESASDWFWETGPDLRFTDFTGRVLDCPDYDPRPLLGKTREDFILPEDRPAAAAHFADLAAHRPFRDFQYRLRLDKAGQEAGGQYRHIRISGKPVFDESGNFLGYRGTGTDVTAQVEAEERLASTQNQLATALESIADGFALWGTDDRLEVFNQAFQRCFPLSAGTIRPGISFAELVRLTHHEGGVQTPAQNRAAWIAERIQRHRNPSGTFELETHDGRWIMVAERKTAEGRTVAIYTDITERKRRESALAETQRIAHVGSWELSFDDNRVQWAEETCRIFGVRPEDFGNSFDEVIALIHPGDRGMVHHAMARAIPSGRLDMLDHRIIRPDGGERNISVRGEVVYDGAGRPLRIIGTVQDVTERIQAEQEMRLAKEQAEAANRTKNEFLANMSHELRTPLNAVIGFSEVIMAEVFGPIANPQYSGYIRNINDSGKHLLEVINDILDVSRIEIGKMDLYIEETGLARIIESSLRLVRERATVAGLTLETDIAADLPSLHVDQRRVKQVLLNLLSNSIKFTKSGGKITLHAGLAADGRQFVTVEDTGIGIAAEDIPKAMAAFGQVDSRLARNFEGTGLGLPLTKALVELHGGSLELTSTPGQGTAVTIWFPAPGGAEDAEARTVAV